MIFNKKRNESKKFINLEVISAKLLLFVALLALGISNSPMQNYYYNFFHSSIFNLFDIKPTLLFLINDGLMTIFFLVVGLEVKYEMLHGSLNSFRKAILPGIGAIGGMVVPAVIYILFNYHNIFLLQGWGVPTATDIAFSLAIVSFSGSRVPFNLKAYLTALAIFDDIAAIIIIALFYTDSIKAIFLGVSFVCLFILFILNKMKIESFFPYTVMGVILWAGFLKSGIHPTLAGVLIAMMIPIENKHKTISPLKKLQQKLHPWVALMILPLFAFANSGMTFANLNQNTLHVTIVLGVFCGLFFGKQIGIFSVTWLAVKYNIATLPDKVRWHELYAITIICGIGFTISLFIGTLAFGQTSNDYLSSIKIGVFAASLLSGVVGYLLLALIYRRSIK